MNSIVQYCVRCEESRSFELLATHEYQEDWDPPEEASFGKCSSCGSPAVFGREFYGAEEIDYSDYYRLYPAEVRKVTYPLPLLVKQAYDEAVRCERAKAWMATAAMVRRAVEAITRDHDPKSENLFETLEKLRVEGVISDEMKTWADGLRVLGNTGAHATPVNIEKTDAGHALDFLQALMEILYDLRPRFTKWQKANAGPRRPAVRAVPDHEAREPEAEN